MSNVLKVKFRKPTMRLLRSYFRIAWIEHSCCKCMIPIFPGDPYIGEVKVWDPRDYEGEKHLIVSKYHEYCPDDDMEEYQEELDEQHEKSSAQITA